MSKDIRVLLSATAFGLGLVVASGIAQADSLYVAPPNLVSAGHPLRLAADHRATQIGDLVTVVINYSITSSSSISNAQKKGSSLAVGPGAGLAGLPLLTFPSTFNGTSSSNSSKAKSDSSTFSTDMMATVIDVLPSGAMVIQGKQNIVIDGEKQSLVVKGTIRPEDIDNTNSIVSTKIADIDAKFDGDSKADHHGLIQKVLDVFF